jgi:phospho-N-acetylmuramoyl-pentapeptide-transferase
VIYHLLYGLRGKASWLGWLNVVRYIPFRVICATLTALLMSFALGPWFIRRLQEKQIGQVVRTDGPESHFSKRGTPTMGGSLILLALIIPTLMWAEPSNTLVWATVAVTVGYGCVGFYDDYSKIRRKSSGGLAGRYKLLAQFAIGGAVVWFLYISDSTHLPADWRAVRHELALPFASFTRHSPSLPRWIYAAFAVLLVVWMSNAVNLTDGLDGLAIGPVMINAGTYLVFAYITGATLAGAVLARYLHVPPEAAAAIGHKGVVFSFSEYLDLPPLRSSGELAIYCGAMIGAGVGFLWYNSYPAQLFMGDVGALALGGGIGMLALLTKNEFLSFLLGGIFFVEGVSVIVQVVSFRLFKKRVFLMAPVHHHFEKLGWPEPKVIVRFWVIQVMLALVALSSLKLR